MDQKPDQETQARDGAIASGKGTVAVGKEGIYVGGDVAGDVLGAGARKTIIAADQAYKVHGLPNPYLGLRSFTYADRDAFGGQRKALRQAVDRLTDPVNPMRLLFVTGASGSGKSSFVQAGLLPDLEDYYTNRHKQTRHGIFRPSSAPMTMLADGLEQLGLPPISGDQLVSLTPEDFNDYFTNNTPDGLVNLLVIDQFEECFTQSVREQREHLFAFLANLAPFSKTQTHVIVTMRVDYLDELFSLVDLWQIAKQGIELRAMAESELKEAILQPLHAAGKKDDFFKEKRFEPALLDRLAKDASQEPGYLPLLQVTLQELWKGGSLVLARYGHLSDAVRDRAEIVYGYEDYDSPVPERARSEADKDEILRIFTDLVEVSLGDDPRRDVRQRRLKNDLVGDSIQSSQLVDSLVKARLLSIDSEIYESGRVDVVDIIHETLIANWKRLSQTVGSKRQNLQCRVRFEQAFAEWQANERKDDYLLGGIRLAEGRELERTGDVALRDLLAQQFLHNSQEKAEIAQRQRTRTAWAVAAVLSILALIAVIAAVFAGNQTRQLAIKEATSIANLGISIAAQRTAVSAQNTAVSEGQRAENLAAERLVQQLILQSESLRASRYDQSLLLSIEALRLADTNETRNSLLQSMRAWPQLTRYIPVIEKPIVLTYSPDGNTLIALTESGLRLWDSLTGELLEPDNKLIDNTIVLTRDNKTGFSSKGKTVLVWNLVSDQKPRFLAGQQTEGQYEVVSPDGKIIATREGEKTISLRDAATGDPLGQLYDHRVGPTDIYSLVFSPDNRTLLVDGEANDDIPFAFILQWELPPSLSDYLKENDEIFYSARALEVYFSGDEYSDNLGGVTEMLFTPDGKQLVVTVQRSSDSTYRIVGDSFTEVWSKEVPITSLAAKCDEALVSGWEDGSISDLPGFKHPAAVDAIAFSQDCRFMASLGGGVITLWDISERELPLEPKIDLIFNSPGLENAALAAWESSGATFWASENGSLEVSSKCRTRRLKFDPMSSCIQSEMEGGYAGFDGIITSLAKNPDGKMTAAGICREYDYGYDHPERCYASEVWLWPGGTKEAVTIIKQEYAVTNLFFSPDGKVLASVTQDGMINFWDVDIESMIADACARVGRDLTEAEWHAFIGTDTPIIPTCPVKILDPHRLDRALRDLQSILPTPIPTIP